ncbi:MAG: retroviral-like aspartic protease family protein [Pseudomonadota bacterium]
MTQAGAQTKAWTKSVVLVLCAILIWPVMQFANATEQRTISFAESSRLGPILEVQINGVAATALLDTGATVALIDDQYLAPLSAPAQLTQRARILGLGGTREYPVASLPNLSVGDRSWRDVRVAVNTSHDFPVEHSILPVSLFQTAIIDFEFSKSRVHLYDGRPKRVRDAPKSTLRYTETERLIFIPIKINGAKGLALIDTGAERSFVNPAYARRAKAIPDEYDQEQMQGSDLSTKTAHLYTFRKLEVGNFEIPKSRIPVLRTDLFEELGYADTPMMVMGMDFLKHFRVQLDRKRKRITLLHTPDGYRRQSLRLQSAKISQYFDR